MDTLRDSTRSGLIALTAAERMRISRERRRSKMRAVTIEVRDAEVDELVRRGFLDPDERGRRDKIGLAIGRLFDEVLDGRLAVPRAAQGVDIRPPATLPRASVTASKCEVLRGFAAYGMPLGQP